MGWAKEVNLEVGTAMVRVRIRVVVIIGVWQL